MKKTLIRHGSVFVALCAVAFVSAPVDAAVFQQFFVSSNNKLYYVLSSTPSSGIGIQMTSIMMSTGTAIPINETLNNPPDAVLTSVSTQLTGSILQVPPLSNIKRTAVLTGFAANQIVNGDNSPTNGEFDVTANNGDGLLILPGGTRTVSFSGSGTEAVQDITSSSGSGTTLVPAAATTTVSRRLGLTIQNSATIVFPNPATSVVTSVGATCAGGTCGAGIACNPAMDAGADTAACGGCGGSCTNYGGEVATQNVTLDDTVSTRVGNDASGADQESVVDGFLLQNTVDLIVFMVDGTGRSAFGLSASGFAVEAVELESRNVLASTGDSDNGNFRVAQAPTPTPGTPAPAASDSVLIALALALVVWGSYRLRQPT